MIDKIVKNKKIVLFGVTFNRYTNMIMDEFYDNVCYFIDNDSEKINQKVDKFDVFSVSKIIEEAKETIFIIILALKESNQLKMVEQLEEIGFVKGKDFECAQTFQDDVSIYELKQDCENLSVEPNTLVIELSSFCNLHCEFCNFHGFENINKGREFFTNWKTIRTIAEQVNGIPSINTICSYHSGEELLNPEWYEMTQYLLSETRINKYKLSTNGMLLNEENIVKLSNLKCEDIQLLISLTGRTEKECELYRKNLSYEVIKKNILNAYDKLSSKMKIELHVDYVNDIEKIQNNCFSFEAVKYDIPQYIIRDFPFIKCSAGPTVVYNPEKIAQAKIPGVKPVRVRNSRSYCRNVFKLLTVDSEGYVLNCCCNGGYIRLGNIMKENMFTIWKEHPTMKNARDKMVKGKMPDFCKNCCYQCGGEFYVLGKG